MRYHLPQREMDFQSDLFEPMSNYPILDANRQLFARTKRLRDDAWNYTGRKDLDEKFSDVLEILIVMERDLMRTLHAMHPHDDQLS